jgi:hypothetical protein
MNSMAKEASTTTARPEAEDLENAREYEHTHENLQECVHEHVHILAHKSPTSLLEAHARPDETTNRRETLNQRIDEDERPFLTKTVFQDMLKDPDFFYNDLNELLHKTADLKAHAENYRKQLQEARQAITRNEAILDRVLAQNPEPTSARTSPSPESSRRPGKIPDPPLFDGTSKDGSTFDNWLIQVKNKLRGNAESYPTEDLKIIYVAGRVNGAALALISPRLGASNSHAYQTVEELYEHLYELYGDPNKERNARQAFKDLVMKKGQTFQEFYALFLRYVADGNIGARDLKDDLNDKLTWKLQESVATYYNDLTITTSQLARYCTTIDQQIRTRFEKRDQASKKPEGPERMSSKPTPRPQVPTNPLSSERLTTTKAGPSLTGLKCYNCFESGHLSRDCPKPPTERTRQIQAAKIAQVSDEKEVNENPGKEHP